MFRGIRKDRTHIIEKGIFVMGIACKKKELMDNLIKADIVSIIIDLIREEQPITMEEVAIRCGVAKGTLYNYFGNKEELINYVHKTIICPIAEIYREMPESTKEPIETIHDFIDAVFSVKEDMVLYFRFVQRKMTVADQLKEKLEVAITPLSKLCAKGIEKGDFVDIDPYVLAEMVFGTVVGPQMSMEFRDVKEPDLEKLKRDVTALVDRIILK